MHETLFVEAVELAHRGRWSDAVEAFARYVSRAGEGAEVLLLWARCLGELGRHVEALPLLERAERLCARPPQRRALRVRALAALGQCARRAGLSGPPSARRHLRQHALAAYRAAAALDPGDRELEACVRQLEESVAAADAAPPTDGSPIAPAAGCETPASS